MKTKIIRHDGMDCRRLDAQDTFGNIHVSLVPAVDAGTTYFAMLLYRTKLDD